MKPVASTLDNTRQPEFLDSEVIAFQSAPYWYAAGAGPKPSEPSMKRFTKAKATLTDVRGE